MKEVSTKIKDHFYIDKGDFVHGCLCLCILESYGDDFAHLLLPGGHRGFLLYRIKDRNLCLSPKCLSKLFPEGSYLTCAVESQENGEIFLSISPTLINEGHSIKEGEVFFGIVVNIFNEKCLVDIGVGKCIAFLNDYSSHFETEPLYVCIESIFENYYLKLNIVDTSIVPNLFNSIYINPCYRYSGIYIGQINENYSKILDENDTELICPALHSLFSLEPTQNVVFRPIYVDYTRKKYIISLKSNIVQQNNKILPSNNELIDVIILLILNDGTLMCSPTDGKDIIVIYHENTIRVKEYRINEAIKIKLLAYDQYCDVFIGCDTEASIIPNNNPPPSFQFDPGTIVQAVYFQTDSSLGHGFVLEKGEKAIAELNYIDKNSEMVKGMSYKAVVLDNTPNFVRIALQKEIVDFFSKRDNRYEFEEYTLSKKPVIAIVNKILHNAIRIELLPTSYVVATKNDLKLRNDQLIEKNFTEGQIMFIIITQYVHNIVCRVSLPPINEDLVSQKVSFVVTSLTKEGVVGYYDDNRIFIPSAHFADNKLLAQKLFSLVKIGNTIDWCIIVSKLAENSYLATKKRCIRGSSDTIPKTENDIRNGGMSYGFISRIGESGSYVSFFNDISVFVPDIILSLGDSVRVFFQKRSNEQVYGILNNNEGETPRYVLSYFHDCTIFASLYHIGQIINICPFIKSTNHYYEYYSNDESWSLISYECFSQKQDVQVAYVDSLSNTVLLCSRIDKNFVISSGTIIDAIIIGVFNPIIVMQYQNTIILSSFCDYTHHKDVSYLFFPGGKIKVSISKKFQEVYIGTPLFLFDDEQMQISLTIQDISPPFANGILKDGRKACIHYLQRSTPFQIGEIVYGEIEINNGKIYMIMDKTKPQNISDFRIGEYAEAIVTGLTSDSMMLSFSPFVEGSMLALDLGKSITDIRVGERIFGNVYGLKYSKIVLKRRDAIEGKNMILGKVLRVSSEGASIMFGVDDMRSLDITEIDDSYPPDPFKNICVGDMSHFYVIDGKNVSLRKSRILGTYIEPEYQIGQIVKGYLIKTNPTLTSFKISRLLSVQTKTDDILRQLKTKTLPPIGSIMNIMINSIIGSTISGAIYESECSILELTPFGEFVQGQIYNCLIMSCNDYKICLKLYDIKANAQFHHPNNPTFLNSHQIGSRIMAVLSKISANSKSIELRYTKYKHHSTSHEPTEKKEGPIWLKYGELPESNRLYYANIKSRNDIGLVVRLEPSGDADGLVYISSLRMKDPEAFLKQNPDGSEVIVRYAKTSESRHRYRYIYYFVV